MWGVAQNTNSLLSALDDSAADGNAVLAQKIELRRGALLYNPGQTADTIYFPLAGLVGIHSETLAGEIVQTGMIGCEGAVGLVEALGSGQYLSRAVVQIPGAALRMSVSGFRQLAATSREFRGAAERYVQMLLTETRQFVVCNALHTVEGRLSRSILDMLDRSCLHRVLPVTQEALALLLGVQRTTVAVSLSRLQRSGLIRNARGAIEVLDPVRLERVACSCRETLKYAREEFSLAPQAHHPGHPNGWKPARTDGPNGVTRAVASPIRARI